MRTGVRVRLILVLSLGAVQLPRTAVADEEISGFLGALCAAIERDDRGYLTRHVHLPLTLLGSRTHQPPTRASGSAAVQLRSLDAVLKARLCDGLDFSTARVLRDGRRWRVLAELGPSDAELQVEPWRGHLMLRAFRRPSAAAPRLVAGPPGDNENDSPAWRAWSAALRQHILAARQRITDCEAQPGSARDRCVCQVLCAVKLEPLPEGATSIVSRWSSGAHIVARRDGTIVECSEDERMLPCSDLEQSSARAAPAVDPTGAIP